MWLKLRCGRNKESWCVRWIMQQSYDPPVIPACHKNELIRDYSYGICLSKPEVKWIQPRLVTWILRKLNFPPRHPIINTTESKITSLADCFGFYLVFVIGIRRIQTRTSVSCIALVGFKIFIATSPPPAQWAWTPCPCPSRRWLQCWWGHRAGLPGTARAEENRVELDLEKN